MRVLGLDPGTQRTGYGCVDLEGDRATAVASGVLCLGPGPLATRLVRLHHELCRLIETHQPEACAVEGVFHHRNARSALVLGHARGICLLAAASHGLEVLEYSPARVKRALTGNGAADKQRVQFMVAHILGGEAGGDFDESDALAVALCHLEAVRPLRVLE